MSESSNDQPPKITIPPKGTLSARGGSGLPADIKASLNATLERTTQLVKQHNKNIEQAFVQLHLAKTDTAAEDLDREKTAEDICHICANYVLVKWRDEYLLDSERDILQILVTALAGLSLVLMVDLGEEWRGMSKEVMEWHEERKGRMEDAADDGG